MHLIADAKIALSKDEWVLEIAKKFGAEARFHTCSASDMTAGALLDFLSARGKLVGTEHSLSLDAAAICQH